MRFTVRTLLVIGAAAALSAPLFAQSAAMPVLHSPEKEQFTALPGLPKCMTASVQQGDPSKEASTLLLKFTPGCVVPWHWHTPNETLMLVTGHGRMEMQDGGKVDVRPGAFAFLPSMHRHQFTCLSGCMTFLISSGPFDIHYVDKAGNEIPADQALAPAKPAMHKSMKKPTGMK